MRTDWECCLELRCQLELKGIEFRLMNVTNLVGEVLAITKLDTVFQLTTDTETLSTIARNCERTGVRDQISKHVGSRRGRLTQ